MKAAVLAIVLLPPTAAAQGRHEEPTLLVWPQSPEVAAEAGRLADRAAERGAFDVVDAGLIRRRIAAGRAVDVRAFLGEAGRAADWALAALSSNDPQRALDILAPATRDFLTDLAAPEGREVLGRLLLARARARLALHDPVAALSDMSLVVRLDAEGHLAGASLGAGERALLERAQREAPAAAVGRLSVRSLPESAEVTVDGAVRGSTPLEVEVGFGEHVVRLDRFGSRPVAQLVRIEPDATAELRVTLEAEQGPDLLEQIASRFQAGHFRFDSRHDLEVLAAGAGVRYVMVVDRQGRLRARLYRQGRLVATGAASPQGPYDALWASLEIAALGRAARGPGTRELHPPTPITARWWFWTAVGVVVVGAVTTGLVVATEEDPGGAVRWRAP